MSRDKLKTDTIFSSRGRRSASSGSVPTSATQADNFSLSEATPESTPGTVTPRSRRTSRDSKPSARTSAATSSLIGEASAVAETVLLAPRRRRSVSATETTDAASDGTFSNDGAGNPTAPMRPQPRPRRAASTAKPKTLQPDATIGGQGRRDTQLNSASSDADQAAMVGPQNQRRLAAWSSIGLYAAAVDDIERTRIALAQRAMAATREGAPWMAEAVATMTELSEGLELWERRAIKSLEEIIVDKTPLGPWIKATPGLGLKSAGRFLGCVGDPRMRPIRGEPTMDEKTGKTKPGPILQWVPRTVSQLWAYCGLDVRDGKAPRRAKGTKGNWNAIARKRAYCMADPCVKNRKSPYRAVYDAARLKYAETEISDGHKHNRAMRAVMKEIVKDIWIEARRFDPGEAIAWAVPRVDPPLRVASQPIEARRGATIRATAPRDGTSLHSVPSVTR